jgi:hypothetical protein
VRLVSLRTQMDVICLNRQAHVLMGIWSKTGIKQLHILINTCYYMYILSISAPLFPLESLRAVSHLHIARKHILPAS